MEEQMICTRQLSVPDALTDAQIGTIAELIYETDKYIYPAIFGTGEQGIDNAVAIIGGLLKSGEDTMFRLDNIFALFEIERAAGDDPSLTDLTEGEIAGIVLWHKGPVEWDPGALLKEAAGLNILLDEKDIRCTEDNYFSDYSDEPDGRISIINVCVQREKRGRGYGNALMDKFIEEHQQEPMDLCVLADNDSAIELYKRHGFAIVREDDGFTLEGEPPRVYFMESN